MTSDRPTVYKIFVVYDRNGNIQAAVYEGYFNDITFFINDRKFDIVYSTHQIIGSYIDTLPSFCDKDLTIPFLSKIYK